MSPLKKAFQSLKSAYTKSDTLVLSLPGVEGELSFVLECSPNRKISEFLEMRDKGLVSTRKFQEIVFSECVVKVGDIDTRSVGSIPIEDDPELKRAFSGAVAVTPKEYLQCMAETAMSDYVLDHVEAIYSHLMLEISKEREKDVKNEYIESMKSRLKNADAVKKVAMSAVKEEGALDSSVAGVGGSKEVMPGINAPPQVSPKEMNVQQSVSPTGNPAPLENTVF